MGRPYLLAMGCARLKRLLMPRITAVQALRPVHRQHAAAARAGPAIDVHADKAADADALYGEKIVDGAGGVLGPVAFVEVKDALAGEVGALEAILEAPADQLLAVLYAAAY